MIIRFLISFWILIQVSVAGPQQQILIALGNNPVSGISVTGAAKGVATTGNASATITPSSGEALIAWACEYGYSTLNGTVTDDLSSAGWTKIGSLTEASGGNIGLSVWYLANASPSITTVIFNHSSGSLYNTICVHRVAGVSTSSPFTTGEFASNSSGTGSNGTSSTVSNGTANSIFFAATVNGSGANPCTFTINSTGTTGTWTLHDSTNSQERNAFDNMPINVVYQIVSSSASRGHGWTYEGSLRWAAAVAVLH